MPNYLVTGGAGFIGGSIARTLVEQGESVRVIDNFCEGKRENLADIADRIDLREADIRDAEAVAAAMQGIDYVTHQAALKTVPSSVAQPMEYNDVNVNGTLCLLLAARDAGVKRFVFASSSAVYGESPTIPKHEEMPPLPVSPYGVTKLAAEFYLRMFPALYGLETVCLRYFNVFGPRQDPKSQYAAVIPNFITRLLAGEPPMIDGDGEQTRDFTFIADTVRANLLACTAPGIAGRVFNIAGGAQTSINELAAIIAEIIGVDIAPVHSADRVGDIKHSVADISAARRSLGFEPSISIQDGLRRTIDWFRK